MLKIIGKFQGYKPTVLCIAGNLCSPHVFDKIHAPEGMQKVYVDYQCSEGPWNMDHMGWRLLETIKQMEIEKPILAGYSAGGVLAMSAAAKKPDVIGGLLLSNTGPCSVGHGNPGFPEELREKFNDEEYIRSFLRSCFYHPISQEMEDQLWQYAHQVSREAAYETTKSLRQVDYREALRKYHNPVMIAHGSLDTRRKMNSVEMMADCMPQAEIVLLQAGHTPMVEVPEDYQQCLNNLARSVFK